MKSVRATAVCIAALYGLDAIWFGGWYFTTAGHVLSEFQTRWLAAHWSASF
jgi:hypothetical protein